MRVDGDGRYAKPLEDPATVYARRQARSEARDRSRLERQDDLQATADEVHIETTLAGPATGPLALDEPSCPKCGGRMWDNRLSKRNPKAPDYKCRNRSCDGVIWPPKAGQRANSNGGGNSTESSAGPLVPEPEPVVAETDQIPF